MCQTHIRIPLPPSLSKLQTHIQVPPSLSLDKAHLQVPDPPAVIMSGRSPLPYPYHSSCQTSFTVSLVKTFTFAGAPCCIYCYATFSFSLASRPSRHYRYRKPTFESHTIPRHYEGAFAIALPYPYHTDFQATSAVSLVKTFSFAGVSK